MINQMVGYAIEGMAIQAAAPHLPAVEGRPGRRGGRPRPAAGRADVRPDAEAENESFLAGLIRELKAAEKARPGSWRCCGRS